MNDTTTKPRKMTPATRRKLVADLTSRLTWQDVAKLDLARGTYAVERVVTAAGFAGYRIYREHQFKGEPIGVATDFDGVLDLIQAD